MPSAPSDELKAKWDREQEELKKHYLEVVVNRFGKELDDMRKEPGVADRLGMLISSLSQGATLMETARLAEDFKAKDVWSISTNGTAAREVAIEALKQKKVEEVKQNGTHEDVEMDSE